MRYWRSYKAPLLVKENNGINHISFNPVTKDLAFTSGTRIQILNSKTQQVYKTIARFKDTTYSGEFRHDGKLLVAGDATGLIQVFNVSNRSVLVTLHPTNYPVHVTRFHPSSLSTLLSASDDRIVRLWDLTSSSPINEFSGHTDYVRTACFAGSNSLIASGCYDGYVRLFDSRADASQGPIVSFYNSEPVESVLSLTDSTIASSAGPVVNVWDLAAGKKLQSLVNFQKTVTCLASAGDKGFLAGSLDGHVKVLDHKESSYSVSFGWKFGGPVLSTGISNDLKYFATGLTTGLLSVRTRKPEKKKAAVEAKPKKGANLSRRLRGSEYKGEFEAQVYQTTKKPSRDSASRLKAYEKHVRAFRWGDALDVALVAGVSSEQTLMVLDELRKRGKVRVSLANRDDESLEPLVKWAVRHMHDSRCVDTIADWIVAVVDLYSPLIERSPILGNLMNQLRKNVNVQVGHAEDAQRIEGMLKLLMA